MSDTSALRWFPRVMAVPLVTFIGARAVNIDDPTEGLLLDISEPTLNAAGVLHGGVIATVLDLAAYLAVLPSIEPDEQAVTHQFSATYLTPTHVGEVVEAKGRLLKRSRHLLFAEATLRSGDRLVASALVTKSVVRIQNEAPPEPAATEGRRG